MTLHREQGNMKWTFPCRTNRFQLHDGTIQKLNGHKIMFPMRHMIVNSFYTGPAKISPLGLMDSKLI